MALTGATCRLVHRVRAIRVACDLLAAAEAAGFDNLAGRPSVIYLF